MAARWRFYSVIIAICFFTNNVSAQELYVMSEPASIMPNRSIIIKQSYQQMGGNIKSTFYNTQLEFSFKKNWMMHLGTNYTASEIYLQHRFIWTGLHYDGQRRGRIANRIAAAV